MAATRLAQGFLFVARGNSNSPTALFRRGRSASHSKPVAHPVCVWAIVSIFRREGIRTGLEQPYRRFKVFRRPKPGGGWRVWGQGSGLGEKARQSSFRGKESDFRRIAGWSHIVPRAGIWPTASRPSSYRVRSALIPRSGFGRLMQHYVFTPPKRFSSRQVCPSNKSADPAVWVGFRYHRTGPGAAPLGSSSISLSGLG